MKNLQTFLNSQGAALTVDGVIGKKTLQAAEDYLLKQCHEKGYRWLDGIIAKRMSNKYTNGMNDFAFVIKGGKVVGAYSWTTVPGHYYIYNPLTVGGITGAAGCLRYSSARKAMASISQVRQRPGAGDEKSSPWMQTKAGIVSAVLLLMGAIVRP
jgi:hypothetical protein